MTTTYSYNAVNGSLGSGRLASIDGPLANDSISYAYDELGRVTSRAINGSTNAVGYDSLGRVTNVVNALGSFNYSYINQTERLSSVAYPNGQTNLYSYYGNSGDQRLQQIHNKNSSGNTISKFDYEYDVTGQITKWTKQADSGNPVAQSFEYDPVDQLISGTFKDTVTQAIVKRYVYGYDDAGNRTSEQVDNTAAHAGYNSLNQMTSMQSGGPTRFKGSLNEAGTVSVAGASATVATNNVFTGSAELAVGSNTVSVIAQDYSSNARTNTYSVVVTNLVNRTLLYDNNGNVTNDAVRSYEWDAANRLTKITQSTNYVAFSYDGFGRRVQIVDISGSTTNSNKRFVWCGARVSEQRDSGGGTVAKQFFKQGVRDSSTNYFYNRDHLGSIREVVDSSAAVVSRYDFDPVGRRTKVSGSYDADFGYTGHYHLQPAWMSTGLNLTWFRIYDPELDRWLSRDPLGNPTMMMTPYPSGDGPLRQALNSFRSRVSMLDPDILLFPNSYAYVRNNSINAWDVLGLVDIWGNGILEGRLQDAAKAQGLSLSDDAAEAVRVEMTDKELEELKKLGDQIDDCKDEKEKEKLKKDQLNILKGIGERLLKSSKTSDSLKNELKKLKEQMEKMK